jgi:hypothetical protein
MIALMEQGLVRECIASIDIYDCVVYIRGGGSIDQKATLFLSFL